VKNEGVCGEMRESEFKENSVYSFCISFLSVSKQEANGEREAVPHSRHLICGLNYVYRFGVGAELVTFSSFTHQRYLLGKIG